MSVHVLRHSILPSHYSDNHKLRVKFNILLGCTSAGDTKGRCLRKCSILKPTLLLVSNAEEQDEIEMSERKKNHLQYLQIKSFSHVINHKNISSILKFWKLIHVIPTILKRSCLVLSYFEQDINKCISILNFTWAALLTYPWLRRCTLIYRPDSIWRWCDDIRLFIRFLLNSELFKVILSSGETSKKDSFLFHKQC